MDTWEWITKKSTLTSQLLKKNYTELNFRITMTETHTVDLDNSQWVDSVYQTYLGRDPEEEGKAYWIKDIDEMVENGETLDIARKRVIGNIKLSPEYKSKHTM